MNILKEYKILSYFGLSFLTGLLLYLAWPPGGFTPLIFLAFVPILFLEEYFTQRKESVPVYYLFFYVFVGFLLWNVSTTYWIWHSAIIAFVLAVVLNSLLMTFPWLLMHYARRTLPGSTGPFMIVFLWLSFEFLHLNWELSWPWLNLGNVFATNTSWIQWYEYTGTLGGSAWILVVNIFVYYLFKTIAYNRTAIRKLVSYSLLLVFSIVLPILISFYIGKNYEEKGDFIEVVIVQPSQDSYKQVESLPEAIRRVDLMRTLAKSKISPETKFVISPETSVPTTILLNRAEVNPAVSMLRMFSTKNHEIAWIAGSFVSKIYYQDKRPNSTAKPVEGRDEFYNLYNSAVLIQGKEPLQFNHKTKLVPGIERMPFYKITRILDPLIKKLGGMAGSYGLQSYRHVFTEKDSIAVASLICYESVFGEFTSKYVKKGANVLFILTNDGWWGNTAGYKQHFHYARLRAIETRRSIARAASTGMSGFIDQKGNVISTAGWNETTAIVSKMRQNDKITFYVYSGDYPGRISVFVSLLLVLYIITQKIIRNKQGIKSKSLL